ncbi:hypothetical protein DOY81_013910 [Sarcophaga bullata]|nr:hypothetical protein DOY81_013910 [Sarcophaga bullata]
MEKRAECIFGIFPQFHTVCTVRSFDLKNTNRATKFGNTTDVDEQQNYHIQVSSNKRSKATQLLFGCFDSQSSGLKRSIHTQSVLLLRR